MPQAFPPKEFLRVLKTGGPLREGRPSALDLQVIFTGVAGTRATLHSAAEYARGLGAQITILEAQVVPYPLPLDSPPVQAEFTERILRDLVSEETVPVGIELYLCRDRNETIRKILKPESLVVIGGRKRWWPTAESRLATLLRRDGHRVIMATPMATPFSA